MTRITYERDLYKSYLVVEKDSADVSYSLQMILNNKITGLLTAELRTLDEVDKIYFDITGKIPLKQMFLKKDIGCNELRFILQGILRGLKGGKGYLLKTSGYLLTPEYIFVDHGLNSLALAYIPWQNSVHRDSNPLEPIIDYLFERMDSTDQNGIMLIHQIMKKMKYGDYSLEGVEAILQHKEEDGLKSEPEAMLSLKLEASKPLVLAKEDIKPEVKKEKSIVNKANTEKKEEQEIKAYPTWVFLACGAIGILSLLAIIFLYTNKPFVNAYTGLRDLPKTIISMGIILILAGYGIFKLTDKKYMIYKIVKVMAAQEEQVVTTPQIYPIQPIIDSADDGKEDETTLLTPKIISEELPFLMALRGERIQHPMRAFPFVMGKSKKDADLLLEENTVSRMHAQIDYWNGIYYIMDLNSKNGTRVNEESIPSYEKRELQEGDVIDIGEFEYVFYKSSDKMGLIK